MIRRTLTVALVLSVSALVPVPLATASSLPSLPGLSSAVAPAPSAGPVGTWSSPQDNAPRITVGADGTLGGYDGCNSFSTTWHQAPGNTIILGSHWMSTKRYCGWEWFPAARTATVDGDTMTVRNTVGAPIGVLYRQ